MLSDCLSFYFYVGELDRAYVVLVGRDWMYVLVGNLSETVSLFKWHSWTDDPHLPMEAAQGVLDAIADSHFNGDRSALLLPDARGGDVYEQMYARFYEPF